MRLMWGVSVSLFVKEWLAVEKRIRNDVKMCGVTQSGHFFHFLHPFDTDNCVLRVFLRFCSCLLLACHLSRYGGEPARKKDKRKNGAWTRTKKEKADNRWGYLPVKKSEIGSCYLSLNCNCLITESTKSESHFCNND